MRNRTGQSTLEYVIILTAIIVAILAFSGRFGGNIGTMMGNVGNSMQSAGDRIQLGAGGGSQ
jgi:Flp pilus assembly pilin Flp